MPLGGRRQRAVLARPAIAGGEVVPADDDRRALPVAARLGICLALAPPHGPGSPP